MGASYSNIAGYFSFDYRHSCWAEALLSLQIIVLCGRLQFMIFAPWLSIMENENIMIISQKAAVIMVSRPLGLCDIECCTNDKHSHTHTRRVIVVAFISDGCVQC